MFAPLVAAVLLATGADAPAAPLGESGAVYRLDVLPAGRGSVQLREALTLHLPRARPETSALYAVRNRQAQARELLRQLLAASNPALTEAQLDRASEALAAGSFRVTDRGLSVSITHGPVIGWPPGAEVPEDRAPAPGSAPLLPLLGTLEARERNGFFLSVLPPLIGGLPAKVIVHHDDARLLSSGPLPEKQEREGTLIWRATTPEPLQVTLRPRLEWVTLLEGSGLSREQLRALGLLWSRLVAIGLATLALFFFWPLNGRRPGKGAIRIWLTVGAGLVAQAIAIAWCARRGPVDVANPVLALLSLAGASVAYFFAIHGVIALVRGLAEDLHGEVRDWLRQARVPTWLIAGVSVALVVDYVVYLSAIRAGGTGGFFGSWKEAEALLTRGRLDLIALGLSVVQSSIAWLRPLAFLVLWTQLLQRLQGLRVATFGDDAQSALRVGAVLFGVAVACVGELSGPVFLSLLVFSAVLFLLAADPRIDGWLHALARANHIPDLTPRTDAISTEMLWRINAYGRLQRVWRKTAAAYTSGDLDEPTFAQQSQAFAAEGQRIRRGDPPETAPGVGDAPIEPPTHYLAVPAGLRLQTLALGIGPSGGPWHNGLDAVKRVWWLVVLPLAFFAQGAVAREQAGHGVLVATVAVAAFWEAAFWLVTAWLVGAFYPYLRGSNGLLKAFWLTAVYAAATGGVWVVGRWLGIDTVSFPIARAFELLIFLAYLGVRLDIAALTRARLHWLHLLDQYRLRDVKMAVGYLAPLVLAFYTVLQHVLSEAALQGVNTALQNADKLIPTSLFGP